MSFWVARRASETSIRGSRVSVLGHRACSCNRATALGYSLATFDWDWEAAEREFKLARELDPNNDDGISVMARFTSRRWDVSTKR